LSKFMTDIKALSGWVLATTVGILGEMNAGA
jgi:hypothetical protein